MPGGLLDHSFLLYVDFYSKTRKSMKIRSAKSESEGNQMLHLDSINAS